MQPDISFSILTNIYVLTAHIYKEKIFNSNSKELSSLQLEIRKIWQQLLQHENIEKHDDLFKLGGDSIAAVQIISAINKEFGIEISMEELFSSDHFSIAFLADLVEKYQINLIGIEEYTALMAEIENLSDEEVTNFLQSKN